MESLANKPNLIFLIWARSTFRNKHYLLTTRLHESPFIKKITIALTSKTITANDIQTWWINGKKHRNDGPAVIYADGGEEWLLNGEFHRDNGPAINYVNGDHSW